MILVGNNKVAIYADDYMRRLLINDLDHYEQEGIIHPVAWCVMSNHAHIILRAGYCDLVDSVHRMNTKFAKRYHLRMKTSGRVFQAPFWSEPIETDEYLIRAVRYVHNNPVKAGLVSSAAEWPWSSYLEYQSDKLSSEKQFAFRLIGGVWKYFSRFHEEKDLGFRPHDTKYDRVMLRDHFARDVTDGIRKRYGVWEWNKESVSEDAMREAVVRLYREGDYTVREISQRLGISAGKISYIVKRYFGQLH